MIVGAVVRERLGCPVKSMHIWPVRLELMSSFRHFYNLAITIQHGSRLFSRTYSISQSCALHRT